MADSDNQCNRNMADFLKTRELLQEISFQKLRVVEMEVAKEALRHELANQIQVFDDHKECAQCKEKSLVLELEQSRSQESRLADEKRGLQLVLNSVKNEFQDVKLSLSESEGKVNAFLKKVTQLENVNTMMDQQASSVLSTLRRTIGYRQESRRIRPRSQSSSRSRSRSSSLRREASKARDVPDIDCGAVETALRDQVTLLATAQRERGDTVCQLKNLSSQLEVTQGEKNSLESKLVRLQKAFSETEQENRDLGVRVCTAQNAMVFQDETLRHSQRNAKVHSDKVFNLERNLNSSTREKVELNETISRRNGDLKRLSEELKELRRQLDDSKHQLVEHELTNKALKGDLQRLKISLTNKETEKEVLTDSAENLNDQIKATEDQNRASQSKNERLKLDLSKGTDRVADQETQIRHLSQALAEAKAKASDLEIKVIQVQRDCNDSRNRSSALQQRYDDSRSAYRDVRKEHHQLLEKTQALQAENENFMFKFSQLDAELRLNQKLLSKKDEEGRGLRQALTKTTCERKELKEQLAVQSLMKTIKSVTPKTTTEKRLDGKKSFSFSTLQLEIEKAELDRKVETLQRQLSELETQHSHQLAETKASVQLESQTDIDRLMSANIQLTIKLESSERTSQQLIKYLEGQLTQLKARSPVAKDFLPPFNRKSETKYSSSGFVSSDSESLDGFLPTKEKSMAQAQPFPSRFGSHRSRSSFKSADEVISRSKESFGRFTRSYSMRR